MMMNNMFSIFDPSSSFFSTNWLIMITIFLLMKYKKMLTPSKTQSILNLIKNFISKEITQLTEKKLKTTKKIFMITFTSIFLMNIFAIFPFNFTPSAHVSISFTIALTMWMASMFFGWGNNFKKMMIHLTPLGTPNSLMNFMVMIEMVSNMIRPITLSIRLSANMVAGHLLMSLLSNFSMMSMNTIIFSSIPMVMLMTLEIGVALVQAYVLMTLLILYQNETS